MRRQNALYYRLNNGGLCVYCGEWEECGDHFLPISKAVMMAEVLDVSSGRFILPSCLECNSIASDKVFETVNHKRDYIQERLKLRWSGYNNFTAKELEEFGYTLWTAVVFNRNKQARLEDRLKWENAKNPNASIAEIFFSPTEHGRNSVGSDVNNNGIGRSDSELLIGHEILREQKELKNLQRELKKANWTKIDIEFYVNCVRQFGKTEADKMMRETQTTDPRSIV